MEHRRPTDRIRVVIDPDLKDLIPGFLENRRNDVRRLQAAVAEHDFETIRTLGHRMRGDGAGYGFAAISDIGSSMEEAAMSKNLEVIMRDIEGLTAYLDRIEVVYE
ncbi:Hpt domain-containing protein [Candidatus Nitrospira bockiana]